MGHYLGVGPACEDRVDLGTSWDEGVAAEGATYHRPSSSARFQT